MIAKLIHIGNSKGLRLPKTVIEKYHLTDELELVESEEGLLIKPISQVRAGWDEMFKAAKGEDDDFSDLMSITNDFDQSEWKW